VNIILTHENSDFDALASAVAAARLYPGSEIMIPETLQPNVQSFVNLYRDFMSFIDPKELDKDIDAIIVVDTNRKERLGKWSSFLDQTVKIIVYDHHHGDEDLGADLAFIEPVGATTTILLEKIIEKNLELTEFEANLFALGIYEDTGCLTYEISTARDARAVAYLWECGISSRLIQEYLRSPLSDAQKDLLERLLRNSDLYELNQRRVLISTTALAQYVVGASVLIQFIDEIEDVGLTIAIIQMSESTYLAARSRDADLNLLELLAPFEVKGYPAAVTAHFKGVDAEDIKKRLLEFLKYYLLPATTAEDVASKPVFTIGSNTSISEADEILAEKNYKGCPVVEDGRLVGIISRRDLRKGLRINLGHAPVKGFMSRKIITVSPGESLQELRRLMVKHNIGRLPVVDKNDNIVGIVTRADILLHLNYLDKKGRFLQAKAISGSTAILPQSKAAEQDALKIQKNIVLLLNNDLPVRMQRLLIQIGQLADREKVKVYLVGGIIRDLLLGYPPEEDLDFVTIGDAVAFTFSLQKLLGGNVRHFEQFGTASLDLQNGLKLDFVTARKELYLTPAALPRVESSSLQNDLFRRDFTINTMACSLSFENYGELYDYYEGQSDLKNKKIRALYQLSFVDDPLRMLRAIRFEQRYHFSIEPETLDSMKNAIERKVLEKVSRQRLNQEIKYIYKEHSPLNILRRFDQLGLIPFLYPHVKLDEDKWQLLEGIERILGWVVEREWRIEPDFELVYLSGLLFSLESADQSAIIRKLSLSRDRTAIIFTACREAPVVLENLHITDLSPSKVVSCLEPLPVEAILLAYVLTDQKIIRDHLKLYMEKLRHVRPGITGFDLKKIGLKPGPRYRKILESLKQAVLDGQVRTPQEELDYITKFLEAEKREDV
jgi:tRNA nucleotidyltransferase (CCA-adding enzyme)